MEDLWFETKRIQFFGNSVQILIQNQNGPCPLLAIANVLLLQRKISLYSLNNNGVAVADINAISLLELIQIIANHIFEINSNNTDLNHRTIIESVLNILPKLSKGLDLNVIFTRVNKFEFTEEISVFDVLSILLFHGWIVEPNTPAAEVVGELSYNLLINKIVDYKSLCDRLESKALGKTNDQNENNTPPTDNLNEEDSKILHEGELVEMFLEASASQFTYAGMLGMYSMMNDRQLAVFFRNNHFSTCFCYNGQIFVLVTDLGYLNEPNVVWELLDRIDGNSEYYNSNFLPLSSVQDVSQPLNYPDVLLDGTIIPNVDSQPSTGNPDFYVGTVARPTSIPANNNNSSRIQEQSAIVAGKQNTNPLDGSLPTGHHNPLHEKQDNYEKDVDQDYLMAMQLQMEENSALNNTNRNNNINHNNNTKNLNSNINNFTNSNDSLEYDNAMMDQQKAMLTHYEQNKRNQESNRINNNNNINNNSNNSNTIIGNILETFTPAPANKNNVNNNNKRTQTSDTSSCCIN
eukprot:gene10797-14495_t